MRVTWGKITVIVGQMNRAQVIDCYRKLESISSAMPDGEEVLLSSIRDYAVRLVVEGTTSIISIDGKVLENGTSALIEPEDSVPFRISSPIRWEDFQLLPYSLSEAWQLAAVTENPFLEEWLKKVLSPLESVTRTEESPSEGGQSTQGATQTDSPETKTTGG